TGGRAMDPHTHDVRGTATLTPDVRAGMGVVFDRGRPEQAEQGGPIFTVERAGTAWRLRFGTPGPYLGDVSIGDFVWISSDPVVTRAGDKAADAGRMALGRVPVNLIVAGDAGEMLDVQATARGRTVRARSTSILETARGAGLTGEI